MSILKSPDSGPRSFDEPLPDTSRSRKAEIRRTILHETRQLSPSVVLEKSQTICHTLAAHPAVQNAHGVALYQAMPHEVTLEPLVASLRARGKRLYLPRVLGPDALAFLAWPEAMVLKRSSFGILEPPDGVYAEVGDIDTFLVPGVAFDVAGHRLGYGKGYYDRALAPFLGKAHFVGICFSLQRVAVLPTDPWDLLMHEVVSESDDSLLRPSRA